MALEERLVDGHIFDTNRSAIAIDFDHPIDHQHRVAVRQDPLHGVDVELGFLDQTFGRGFDRFLLEQFADQFVIQMMPRAAGVNSATDKPPKDHQIPDQIEDLVPHAFILETEFVIDRAIGADDHDVFVGQVRAETGGTELIGLDMGDECPGRGDLLEIIFRIERVAEQLPTDRIVTSVVELVDDVEPIRFAGPRRPVRPEPSLIRTGSRTLK
jgi:hypothetical protein